MLDSSAGDADDRIRYDMTIGDVPFDRDESGAAAENLFASVSSGTPLTHGNFFIDD